MNPVRIAAFMTTVLWSTPILLPTPLGHGRSGWFLSDRRDQKRETKSITTTDLERAYEIVCLMVDSDNQDTSRILVRTRTMHASGILASGALSHLGAGA
jgi:hypothetical protein